jgi:hypothetical protein
MHPPVVDPSEALRDRRLASGPVANCEVDRQQFVAEAAL